ncbi:GNAT family N-acetyltransferase [Streptomyces yaizuensis]|uniref:GNAT family N-acetyltransferase n=1 Tax=Streptomyces yaizuensis TaxID=2989713 RepID=A0ABQ5NYU4_9ACTN|nr:GNAT family N-acetyltransferase [Streptomyces sp. YSPA8]GLF95439.1 GNAT family N-acetyltransferase [Streptomyces sp. YSPA8]
MADTTGEGRSGGTEEWRVDDTPAPDVCADVLAAAFARESATQWICHGSDVVRKRWFTVLLDTQATVAGSRRLLLTDGRGRATGAAVLTPPGADPSAGAQARWAARTLTLCGGRALTRTLRYLHRTESLAPPGAWTLEFIGVRPEAAGRGAGRLLLGRLLATAPAPGGVFLTTADHANVAFYEGFGFTVLDRPRVGPLETTAMWRPPGPVRPEEPRPL